VGRRTGPLDIQSGMQYRFFIEGEKLPYYVNKNAVSGGTFTSKGH
jgi:hypothetical protein